MIAVAQLARLRRRGAWPPCGLAAASHLSIFGVQKRSSEVSLGMEDSMPTSRNARLVYSYVQRRKARAWNKDESSMNSVVSVQRILCAVTRCGRSSIALASNYTESQIEAY